MGIVQITIRNQDLVYTYCIYVYPMHLYKIKLFVQCIAYEVIIFFFVPVNTPGTAFVQTEDSHFEVGKI